MKKLLLLILILFAVIFSRNTKSQNSQGIIVTPSILQLDLSSSKPEANIIYKNTTNSEVELALSAQDFAPLEDARRFLFLDPKESANYKYSLSSWIKFDNPNVSLAPGEQKGVKVFIDANSLSPGGHYASVQAEIKQATGSEQINVKGILSSLLFVRTVTGNEVETAEVKDFKKESRNWLWDDRYSFRFNNSGNVELVPFGKIEITDPSGKIVAKGILNESGTITLPESIRSYEISAKSQKSFKLPGYYKADLNIRYGKSENEVSQTIKFFSLGDIKVLIFIVISIIAVVVIMVFGIRKFRRKAGAK